MDICELFTKDLNFKVGKTRMY